MKVNIRCRYSEEGMRALRRRKPNREDTISSEFTNTYIVKWDGLRTSQCYAKIFIEPIGILNIDMRGRLSSNEVGQ